MHRYPWLPLALIPPTEAADQRERYGGGELLSVKHARFIDPRVPYHIVCKTLQGFCLLRPDQRPALRHLIAGVIGRAQGNYPSVELFAAAFLSNHFHMMLRGDARGVVGFIAFCKREISRRWAPKIGWSGPMWGKYHATALVTEGAQIRCLRYFLSQGVHEGLVAHPNQWPGFHCAAALLANRACTGEWLDATAYGRAKYKESIKNKPRAVHQDDFVITYTVAFAKLPARQALSDVEYRAAIAGLVDDVVTKARDGKPPLGVEGILRTPLMQRRPPPSLPWFVLRRHLIAWDDPTAPEVIEYKKAYW